MKTTQNSTINEDHRSANEHDDCGSKIAACVAAGVAPHTEWGRNPTKPGAYWARESDSINPERRRYLVSMKPTCTVPEVLCCDPKEGKDLVGPLSSEWEFFGPLL